MKHVIALLLIAAPLGAMPAYAAGGMTFGPGGPYTHTPGATIGPRGEIYLETPGTTIAPNGDVYHHLPGATLGPNGETWLHTPGATFGPHGDMYLEQPAGDAADGTPKAERNPWGRKP